MIALIEHGQTALDARGESHGGRDVPLNAEGRRQAVRLGRGMRRANPAVEVIFHSPKLRARQTARIAGAVAGVPARESAALAPLRSGALGAGPEREAARRLAPYFAAPERKIPGGERVADWRARHMGLMRRLLRRGRNAALVTHSNVIGSVADGPDGARRAMAHSPGQAEVALTISKEDPEMADLTTKERNRLPRGKFALPDKRAYPIPDASHARNALSRAAQNASPHEQAEIRRNVHRLYPRIKISK